MNDMPKHSHIADSISGYLDGELTQADRQRVELHIESCTQCRKIYDEMSSLRDSVSQLSFGELSPEQWGEIMNHVTVRGSRSLGWIFYVVGLMIVTGFGFWAFLTDDEIPALLKTGIVGIVVGLLLLFFSVAQQRLTALKSDKYKDVEI